MATRQIIEIDEEKCNGCGLCIPNCPEGALQIIDDKARLISDLFCDGLGACIGHCPEGAIKTVEREAEPYDEKKVMKKIVRQGENVITAHLKHLKDHNQTEFYNQAIQYLKENNIDYDIVDEKPEHQHAFEGCPGTRVMNFNKDDIPSEESADTVKRISHLRQWPVQIMLVPPSAPYFENADILIAADCVPFAYADFHKDFLKNKVVLVGCPKLDDPAFYEEKFTNIFQNNNIKSVTIAHMEVPCCFGIVQLTKNAVSKSGKDIPIKDVTISIKGEQHDGI